MHFHIYPTIIYSHSSNQLIRHNLYMHAGEIFFFFLESTKKKTKEEEINCIRPICVRLFYSLLCLHCLFVFHLPYTICNILEFKRKRNVLDIFIYIYPSQSSMPWTIRRHLRKSCAIRTMVPRKTTLMRKNSKNSSHMYLDQKKA